MQKSCISICYFIIFGDFTIILKYENADKEWVCPNFSMEL